MGMFAAPRQPSPTVRVAAVVIPSGSFPRERIFMKTYTSIPLTAELIAEWVGGELILAGGGETQPIWSVCTDSREIESGGLFCAIRGERVDGHSYIPTAWTAGCACVLCEQVPEGLDGCYIRVEDTVAALSRLAAGVRDTYLSELSVTAVTGSVGKTTVKELCAAVLREQVPTFCREGNYNSVIGMPLCVLGIGTEYRAAVLEMGMSARGEISAMSRAARPTIAVITNVGSSHLAYLGTRENIARAKLEILDGMHPGGHLVLCGDEPLLLQELPPAYRDGTAGVTVHAVSAKDPSADFFLSDIRPTGEGTAFSLRLPSGAIWSDLYVPAHGVHMALDAAYAAAVGYLSGMGREAVARGLGGYRAAHLRQETRRVGDVMLVLDCYNAAPESVRAALDTLADLPANGRRLALLGDMRELGTDSDSLHRAVGEYVAARLDGLWTVGASGAQIAAGAADGGLPFVRAFAAEGGKADSEEVAATIAAAIAEALRPGDVLLIKASRALRLETVAERLTEILKGQL